MHINSFARTRLIPEGQSNQRTIVEFNKAENVGRQKAEGFVGLEMPIAIYDKVLYKKNDTENPYLLYKTLKTYREYDLHLCESRQIKN